MDKVLLITMPFSTATAPSLGISLLRAALERQGVPCDIRYLQLPFAAKIGLGLYSRLSGSTPSLLLGEWLFAHPLFGDQLPDPERYTEDILMQSIPTRSRKSQSEAEDLIAQVPRLRALTAPYLETCMSAIPWEQYGVVGFSTTFEQNTASLALAQQIKEAWPDMIIVFGGANCEGEMGAELHRQFPFVDYVCSGESDQLFPALIQRLVAGREVDDLQGLIYRQNGKTVANGSHALPIFDLDELPFPDYDDYFAQIEESGLEFDPEDLWLVLETSRGCWWGVKSHCTFCGLNNNTIVYRSKSGERVLEEFTYLTRRYPDIKYVDVADNILDYSYFRDVIPGLIERDLGRTIFWEIKANLRKDQLRMLKLAGVEWLQPGIESLDSDVLRLMRKGCTTIQNVQLLKWAREFGIRLDWNLLSGFPGEDPTAYQRMAEMIPSLVHLQPPWMGLVSQLRLDRFSPYFHEPEANGMVRVRPAAAYHYVYPFPEENLARLAYYFDFDHEDGRQPQTYISVLGKAVKQWQAQSDSCSLRSLRTDGRLTLYDARPDARQREIVLKGIAKVIYEYCDEGRSFDAIIHHLETLGEPHASHADVTTVQSLLDSLVDARLMLYADNRFLSLAIPMDERARGFIDNFVEALIVPESNLGSDSRRRHG